jgi:hypothetical protein
MNEIIIDKPVRFIESSSFSGSTIANSYFKVIAEPKIEMNERYVANTAISDGEYILEMIGARKTVAICATAVPDINVSTSL